nr:MAG TPA: ASCH domain protein [Caudoviricetes sp.]
MAIKPILFNTEMVQAILDGRKTCTRRIVKGAIPDDAICGYTVFTPQGYISCRGTLPVGYGERFFKLPYQKGDILYVRETWTRFECWNCDGDEEGNCVKEPHISVLEKQCGCYLYRATSEISGDARWHPSIHMPKEAARIWLKVTDVRVERLQDITEDGAKTEGANWKNGQNVGWEEKMKRTATERFAEIWDSTIKKSDIDRYGWDANPWVWVIEFERCEKPKGVQE